MQLSRVTPSEDFKTTLENGTAKNHRTLLSVGKETETKWTFGFGSLWFAFQRKVACHGSQWRHFPMALVVWKSSDSMTDAIKALFYERNRPKKVTMFFNVIFRPANEVFYILRTAYKVPLGNPNTDYIFWPMPFLSSEDMKHGSVKH